MNKGFIRLAAAVPGVRVGDCFYNTRQIANQIRQADEQKVQIVCFPELSVTAYTCGDLFHQRILIDEAENALASLLAETQKTEIIAIIGLPVLQNNCLYNAAVAIQGGNILSAVPKTYLPNYGEFYEKRWFTSGVNASPVISICGKSVPFGTQILLRYGELVFGIEICEDLWVTIPPSSYQALCGANVIFNLSASNELIGKNSYLKDLVRQQSARCMATYVYASAGAGESTQDIVFAGNALIAENGEMLAESKRFDFDEQLVIADVDVQKLNVDRLKHCSFADNAANLTDKNTAQVIDIDIPKYQHKKLMRKIQPLPFVPSRTEDRNERCEEIFSIQTGGLAKRILHTNLRHLVVGISGGLDSTLALLVCIKTFDKLGIPRRQITGITMPGFGTTERTYTNAVNLMKSLGVTMREINITKACEQHFKDIGHNPEIHDTTYENIQARERTQILMDVANQENGLVAGTGDLSELALGWATYNGDHMSMYGINSSIPKTLVRHLVTWAAEQFDEKTKSVLTDIVKTPVSPELLPADSKGNILQRTEDVIGPYELHDFFLYYTLRYGFRPSKIFFLAQQAFTNIQADEIKKWMKVFYSRFFAQQFKRSCLPDGPKTGSVNLSPRGDWRMPSDASAALWLKEAEEM
ncbi:MAG: NAD(+) synthase [Prevotellaceae bacterium]|jgi:NAD+ synthase (glutamine-hydrolysing)|nr:NAD(+) synthase [Prevotellaceae bacterium]